MDFNGENAVKKNHKGAQIKVNSPDNSKRIREELNRKTPQGRQKAVEIATYSITRQYENDWHTTAYEMEFPDHNRAADISFDMNDKNRFSVMALDENLEMTEVISVNVEDGNLEEALKDFIGGDDEFSKSVQYFVDFYEKKSNISMTDIIDDLEYNDESYKPDSGDPNEIKHIGNLIVMFRELYKKYFPEAEELPESVDDNNEQE